jgi:hypothetical protein
MFTESRSELLFSSKPVLQNQSTLDQAASGGPREQALRLNALEAMVSGMSSRGVTAGETVNPASSKHAADAFTCHSQMRQ